MNKLCLSYQQRKGRNHHSGLSVFRGIVKELRAVIHPGSDQKCRNAFIMVDYVGQKAKGFLWVLAYGWQIYCWDTEQPTMAYGPVDVTNTGDLGIFSLHCILFQDPWAPVMGGCGYCWQEQQCWMLIVLKGTGFIGCYGNNETEQECRREVSNKM